MKEIDDGDCWERVFNEKTRKSDQKDLWKERGRGGGKKGRGGEGGEEPFEGAITIVSGDKLSRKRDEKWRRTTSLIFISATLSQKPPPRTQPQHCQKPNTPYNNIRTEEKSAKHPKNSLPTKKILGAAKRKLKGGEPEND